MRKSIATLALVAALAATAGACSSGTDTLTRSSLVKKLQDTGKLDKAFATCVADELFTSTDKKVVLTTKEKKDFNSTTLASDVQTTLVRKAAKAGDACKAKGISPS